MYSSFTVNFFRNRHALYSYNKPKLLFSLVFWEPIFCCDSILQKALNNQILESSRKKTYFRFCFQAKTRDLGSDSDCNGNFQGTTRDYLLLISIYIVSKHAASDLLHSDLPIYSSSHNNLFTLIHWMLIQAALYYVYVTFLWILQLMCSRQRKRGRAEEREC